MTSNPTAQSTRLAIPRLTAEDRKLIFAVRTSQSLDSLADGLGEAPTIVERQLVALTQKLEMLNGAVGGRVRKPLAPR